MYVKIKRQSCLFQCSLYFPSRHQYVQYIWNCSTFSLIFLHFIIVVNFFSSVFPLRLTSLFMQSAIINQCTFALLLSLSLFSYYHVLLFILFSMELSSNHRNIQNVSCFFVDYSLLWVWWTFACLIGLFLSILFANSVTHRLILLRTNQFDAFCQFKK